MILRRQRLFLSFRDEIFLRECCALAWSKQTLALPNPSVGAIVCDASGEIIGRGVHSKVGMPHAEILALQEAYCTLTGDRKIMEFDQSEAIHQYLLTHHNGLFTQCTLYVSLEPCNHQGRTPSCASLMIALMIARICVGARDVHPLASGGADRIRQAGIDIHFTSSSFIQAFASNLLLPFDILRTKGRFVLFKIAQRLDGSFCNGRISCKDSQCFTHNQRSVCDWIVISGQTFRTDHPRLNARHAISPYNNKALPKIGILSQSLSMPLAKTCFKQTEVRILSDASELSELRGFVVIEGGWRLLSQIRIYVDMLLVHQAFCLRDLEEPHFGSRDLRFNLIHSMPLGEDMALWLV